MCLFLHQHLSLDSCPYISLKSGRVSPPTIFFFFKIASSIPVPCLSIQILRESFIYLQKCLAGTLIGIVSNLYFNLERTDTFTMLSPLIYGHTVTVHLSRSSLVSFMSIFCSFQHTSTIHPFLHLYLVFNFWVIISSTIILVSMSVCSWIVYRNAIGIFICWFCILSFPGSSDSKESACNVRGPVSIPGSGICPGEGSANPLQYSWLENFTDTSVCQVTVHGIAKSRTQLSNFHFQSIRIWELRL